MLFISFEGPEGAGKSTQIARLAHSLQAKGYAVTQTREPGGTAVGTRIREVLLDPNLGEMEPLTEFLLYSASRAQLVREVIQPALGRGEIVLCDRYLDSSMAYQGFGRGLELQVLRDISWEVTGGMRPHLTFLLDLDPELGLERVAARGATDRLEQADLAFHRRVRAGFLELAQAEPERFVVLDAQNTADDLATTILNILSPTLVLCTTTL